MRTYPELGAVTQPMAGWVVRPSCLTVLMGLERVEMAGGEQPRPGATNINQNPGPGPVNTQSKSASHNRLDGGNFSLLLSSGDTQ